MMKHIPESYLAPSPVRGRIETIPYRNKFGLLYTPVKPAKRILYLIHGGGGDQYAFMCPDFVNMIDHMIAAGELAPLYIVAPCFYDPAETDKTPVSSGRAVAVFCDELRREILPAVEGRIGATFDRRDRIISGFSMGGVTTWYAFLQAMDLFQWFLPLSGDCWVCGETGGGSHPDETAAILADTARSQGLPYHIHAITGDKDIAWPNLDAQIRATRAFPDLFGEDNLEYTVLPGGVHDYETMFRYLYNALPEVELGERIRRMVSPKPSQNVFPDWKSTKATRSPCIPGNKTVLSRSKRLIGTDRRHL